MFTYSSMNHPSDHRTRDDYLDYLDMEGLTEEEFSEEDFWNYLVEQAEDLAISQYEYYRELGE